MVKDLSCSITGCDNDSTAGAVRRPGLIGGIINTVGGVAHSIKNTACDLGKPIANVVTPLKPIHHTLCGGRGGHLPGHGPIYKPSSPGMIGNIINSIGGVAHGVKDVGCGLVKPVVKVVKPLEPLHDTVCGGLDYMNSGNDDDDGDVNSGGDKQAPTVPDYTSPSTDYPTGYADKEPLDDTEPSDDHYGEPDCEEPYKEEQQVEASTDATPSGDYEVPCEEDEVKAEVDYEEEEGVHDNAEDTSEDVYEKDKYEEPESITKSSAGRVSTVAVALVVTLFV